MEVSMDVLQKLKTEVALIFLGIDPKNSKSIYFRDNCKSTFMTTWFMVAWKLSNLYVHTNKERKHSSWTQWNFIQT